MYRGALRSMLSELLRQDALLAIDKIEISSPKTKELVARLNELQLDSVLIVVDQYDRDLCLAARNLPKVDVLDLREVDPVSLLRFDKVLVTKKALQGLEEKLS